METLLYYQYWAKLIGDHNTVIKQMLSWVGRVMGGGVGVVNWITRKVWRGEGQRKWRWRGGQ